MARELVYCRCGADAEAESPSSDALLRSALQASDVTHLTGAGLSTCRIGRKTMQTLICHLVPRALLKAPNASQTHTCQLSGPAATLLLVEGFMMRCFTSAAPGATWHAALML